MKDTSQFLDLVKAQQICDNDDDDTICTSNVILTWYFLILSPDKTCWRIR